MNCFTTLQHNKCGKMYCSVWSCFECFQTIYRCVSFAHTTTEMGYFFLNRWYHEEVWNCSNILLNLYDINRNNRLYYQVISNVFRSKCYLSWIEKKYKGFMLGPLLFLVYINDIVQSIYVFLQIMLLHSYLLTIPSLLVIRSIMT